VPRRQERASRHVTSHVRDVTLSQDGKLLAYVAALAGDLPHIWVRQALGGTAIQATRGHEPDTTPDFSPDGTRIAFLSARDGGGIYIGPSLGGESKLLVRNGAAPRFSPDGNAVLYWNRQRSVFTIPVVGGSPHVVEALNSYQLATPPRWSPDGSELIFRGTKRGRAPSEHWWIVPLSGGPGRIAWLPGIERDQGQFPPVRDWRRTRDGRSWIVYSIQGADGWTLYRIEDDPGGKTRHTPESIASGAGQLGLNSRLSEDEKLAYNTLVLGGSIYAIPQLRGRKGAGPVERLPLSEELNCHSPALSRDGRWMIYSSSNEQQSSRVILRDLRDGSERLLDDEGVGPDGVGGNSISPDGSRVTVSRRSKGRVSSILLPTAKGDSEELCENCTARGFSSDESTVLVEQYAVPGEGADSIVSCNLATNTHRVFLQDRSRSVSGLLFVGRPLGCVYPATRHGFSDPDRSGTERHGRKAG
jgi:dipeptidyl aminopeptidase/acylaminoacyl peptidase